MKPQLSGKNHSQHSYKRNLQATIKETQEINFGVFVLKTTTYKSPINQEFKLGLLFEKTIRRKQKLDKQTFIKISRKVNRRVEEQGNRNQKFMEFLEFIRFFFDQKKNPPFSQFCDNQELEDLKEEVRIQLENNDTKQKSSKQEFLGTNYLDKLSRNSGSSFAPISMTGLRVSKDDDMLRNEQNSSKNSISLNYEQFESSNIRSHRQLLFSTQKSQKSLKSNKSIPFQQRLSSLTKKEENKDYFIIGNQELNTERKISEFSDKIGEEVQEEQEKEEEMFEQQQEYTLSTIRTDQGLQINAAPPQSKSFIKESKDSIIELTNNIGSKGKRLLNKYI